MSNQPVSELELLRLELGAWKQATASIAPAFLPTITEEVRQAMAVWQPYETWLHLRQTGEGFGFTTRLDYTADTGNPFPGLQSWRVVYLLDDLPTGIESHLFPNGMALTTFRGERLLGTSYTREREWLDDQFAAARARYVSPENASEVPAVMEELAENDSPAP